jgi:hypothetical protein
VPDTGSDRDGPGNLEADIDNLTGGNRILGNLEKQGQAFSLIPGIRADMRFNFFSP